jgi:hypothetical protein
MLIHAIVMTGLVFTVVAVVTTVLVARVGAVRSARDSLQATYAAESGVAAVVAAMRHGRSVDAALRGELAHCAWQVALREDRSKQEILLDSTGDCAGRRRRVVYAVVGSDRSLRRVD